MLCSLHLPNLQIRIKGLNWNVCHLKSLKQHRNCMCLVSPRITCRNMNPALPDVMLSLWRLRQVWRAVGPARCRSGPAPMIQIAGTNAFVPLKTTIPLALCSGRLPWMNFYRRILRRFVMELPSSTVTLSHPVTAFVTVKVE